MNTQFPGDYRIRSIYCQGFFSRHLLETSEMQTHTHTHSSNILYRLNKQQALLSSFPLSSIPFSSGMTLTFLQLALKFASLAYIPAFTKIYQGTLDWFPGFVFTLASIFTVLGMTPIRYVCPSLQTNVPAFQSLIVSSPLSTPSSIIGCRSPQRWQYEKI